VQSHESAGQQVELRLPALESGLPIARTFVAAAAAGWGYTLDVIEDARLVTSELLTMIIQASPGALVEVSLSQRDDGLQVKVHTDALCPPPPKDSFGWMVVSEVSESFDLRSDSGGLTLVAAMTPAGLTG